MATLADAFPENEIPVIGPNTWIKCPGDLLGCFCSVGQFEFQLITFHKNGICGRWDDVRLKKHYYPDKFSKEDIQIMIGKEFSLNRFEIVENPLFKNSKKELGKREVEID